MATSFADVVPIPPNINRNLSACREDKMLKKFGKPGTLSSKCAAPAGAVKALIKFGVPVGPFKVSGMDYAVESLTQIFLDVSNKFPDIYGQVKTAGMLCVRSIRHNPAHFSNHSWGTAIDLYFGEGVLPQGRHMTQRGFLYLYETFNSHGWFWGAGFSGGAVDAMHFELSNETIDNIGIKNENDLIAASEYIKDTGYNNNFENDA